MNTREAYNDWAASYDTVFNKTRDLESSSIQALLKDIYVDTIIEIGCGTGKNTGWLAEQCKSLLAVDFSAAMLSIAREKWKHKPIQFIDADIMLPWNFPSADLVTCSLVLEHVQDLTFIFHQAAKTLKPGGSFYVCELHPYRQLNGSRARFEKEGVLYELEYFVHHISDYFNAAGTAGFLVERLQEWFDHDTENPLPRLVSFLFTKR